MIEIDETKYENATFKCNIIIPTDMATSYTFDIKIECTLNESPCVIINNLSNNDTNDKRIEIKYLPIYTGPYSSDFILASRILPNHETLSNGSVHTFHVYNENNYIRFAVDDLVTYAQNVVICKPVDDKTTIEIKDTDYVYSIYWIGYHNNEHLLLPVKRLEDNKYGFYDTYNDDFYEVEDVTYVKGVLDLNEVNKIVIPEGNVLSITKDGEEDPLWSAKKIYGYGIKWNTGEKPTRIGNMNLHKTLPIQSNFKCCVHQGTDIQYYLNEQDSRFVSADIRESFTFDITEMQPTDCDGLPSGVISCEESSIVKVKFINKTLFSNYRFLYSYVYLRGNTTTEAIAIGRIVHIDVETGEAYIDDSIEIQTSNYIYNESEDIRCLVWGVLNDQNIQDCTVELGASLNGYDGELGVDTGAKFYQWSVDKEGKGNEVWISQYKCVPYAKEVKRHIIGCSRACVLNSAFNDAKWGWIGSISSNTSVNVINYNSRLRGGINNINFDKYLGDDNFRCQLNKGRTNISLFQMRQYTQKLANHQVLYKQLWEAIVWCYCIEYCSLNVKNNFNNTLTTEGYHQGGLGQGYSIGGNYLVKYNNNECFTPCDYTLHLGNSTGIRKRQSKNFTFNTTNNLIWKNNIWTTNNVTWDNAVDNNNAKCKITKIAASNAILQAESNNVSGTVTYKVEGLTNNQYIIFNREKGSLTITVDGTYVIEWGNGTASRRITFGIAQDSCEIYIEALSATDNYVNITQSSWEIPHWRGFNVFWYGDIWLNIENFLSKYDTTKQRRIYYWTDDVTKFDNSIDNKEHSLEDVLNVKSDLVNEFNLGKQGNLLIRKYGSNNYINTFHWDNVDTKVHISLLGGQVSYGFLCGLGSLYSNNVVGDVHTTIGFVTCTIID